ncbi:AMP-binding protein [Nocardia sp. NPDC004068]|uniref:AMP-binding protein n=1 Tax=Nocardia sp. NPDC004068 TaxID=3364303 RepID=UPI0036B0BE2D
MTALAETDDAGRRLHEWFRTGARVNPDGGALLLGSRVWTYAEAEDTARRWAGSLRSAVQRPRRVGLLAAHSAESYLGLLATLFSGAAVVPLNPVVPQSRNAELARRVGLDALVVDAAGMPQIPAILDAVPSLTVLAPSIPRPPGRPGAVWLGPADCAAGALDPLPRPSARDIAYVLFTSGSTGRPKGVPISHANIDHFLSVAHDRYRLGPGDRVCQATEQTFDVALFNQFLAWGSGTLLCPASPRERLQPVEFVDEHDITVWSSVPGVIAFAQAQGMLPPGSMTGLRWSLFAGEQLRREHAEAWQAAAPGSIVENLYGPTELTIVCTAYRWRPAASPAHCVHGAVPIGEPLPGTRTHVLPDPAAPGRGELCVRGPQQFGGYLDPADDAGRFLHHEGRRWFRTGDLVETHPQAGLVFLGRADNQVKIRGHRVELGEIEAIFLAHHPVTEAVAVVPSAMADAVVVFYSGPPIAAQESRARLRELVPEYLVPARIIRLPALPRTAHGKVDRMRLRELAAE